MIHPEKFAQTLASLHAQIKTPKLGLFGPRSKVWELNKESIIFLGGGRAALLQLAHPFVAHAIDQHSKTKRDPLLRFQRTFHFVFDMVFGDLEHATQAAQRVRRIHDRIWGQLTESSEGFLQGTNYSAHDRDAVFWVGATLFETSVQVYERLIRPLQWAEKERYYQESKRFLALFGIPPEEQPARWSDFLAYVHRMCNDVLTVGSPAKEIAHFLLYTPRWRLKLPIGGLRVLTTGLLPARLREAYGLPFGRTEQAMFEAMTRMLWHSYHHLPEELRTLPAYQKALHRIYGTPPTRLEQTASRTGQWLVESLLAPSLRTRLAAFK